METAKLRKFSSFARNCLIEQVGTKLEAVLADGSPARRENEKAVRELEQQLETLGREQLVERVAYTWFNRFCALRYMDVNRYTRIGILSPEPGRFQPEILAEAKAGHMDPDMVPEATRRKVSDLLDGSVPSKDPQGEAYRLLLVAACNYYHQLMPFMFEKISDYTELLLPDDLLSGNSILAYTRETLLPANCSPEYTDESVEVIGWLYQFYISEKKDEVFEGLKKGKKISPENIPAATQLFTPHWIVRYLVENSLGRLWMLNHPESKLVERMEYYIRPEEPETDFLRIARPEEVKICDPACGSGHMLTYAFDLLYAIYEEQGYQANDIPRLILQNNLYGIEIDQRAGALAAFALTMKACERDNRFFRRRSARGEPVEPNICVLENIHIELAGLSAYMDHVGRDLFNAGLQDVVNQFQQADNLGSLIRPSVSDVSEPLKRLRDRNVDEDMFLASVHQKVLKALTQADYLCPQYHVVVANPPYMGGKNLSPELKDFAGVNFASGKADLYSMFFLRSPLFLAEYGFIALVTPFTWMFLSTFKGLRADLLQSWSLNTLVRPEYHAFFESAYVPLCAFVFENRRRKNHSSVFIDLCEFYGAHLQAPRAREAIANPQCGWSYRVRTDEFLKIPGYSLAYKLEEPLRRAFDRDVRMSDVFFSDGLTKTGDNEKYLRFHWEVRRADSTDVDKYRICVKGGEARKYYGNTDVVVKWDVSSRTHYREDHVARITPEYLWNAEGISWTKISSKGATFRWFGDGMIAETGGPAIFLRESLAPQTLLTGLGFLSSNACVSILDSINPTLNIQTSDVLSLPFNGCGVGEGASEAVEHLLNISKTDWNTQETSFSFERSEVPRCTLLREAYVELGKVRRSRVERTLELEGDLNCLFDRVFGIRTERLSTVQDITLVGNPLSRYGSDKSDSELEALLLSDTMREFISYAVGCMFGRYSLDKPGLILANQGETADDYRRQIPEPAFPPDEDNVIPLLDGDWFPDDISERFKKFLKVTFGTEHYEENLTFLENALYPENQQARRRKTIRDYFLKEFYDHHVKMYKKRPIYWLFSSPKGTFNALIYMHRYRPDTVSVVLNEYLREFHAKVTATVEHLQTVANSGAASAADKAKALKEMAKLKKDLKELEDYERNVLYPLAARQVEIDLDDGVKVNYNKFGKALKKVTGLSE